MAVSLRLLGYPGAVGHVCELAGPDLEARLLARGFRGGGNHFALGDSLANPLGQGQEVQISDEGITLRTRTLYGRGEVLFLDHAGNITELEP
jgi:hypothetical protein